MDQIPEWANLSIAIAGALGTLVTAVATFFLWRVTKILARETTRMAEASAQPHVVATLAPNRWSVIHFDFNVENTGNATAYDVIISFDPPLENGEERSDRESVPLQNISVIKPSQGLTSFLTNYETLKGKVFNVNISWKKSATSETREENKYTLKMSDYDDVSYLGGDPSVEISKNIKKIKESLSAVFKGNQRLKTDVYTSSDRDKENELARERFNSITERKNQKK